MNKIDLPKEFIAFEELDFCSNILQNCAIPVEVDDEPIVLVGNGEQPRIWLWGLVDLKSKGLAAVVSSNINKIFTAPIKIESKDSYTCVKLNEIIIIKTVKFSDKKAVVEQLDMRPLGFNIYGNAGVLNVGTIPMVGNAIVNCRVAIALNF